MENNQVLYKPKDLYERSLKEQYHKGAKEYFEKLTKEANIDVEANAKHVSEYKNLLQKQKDAEKNLGSSKGLRTFFIFLIVICFAGALGLAVAGILNISTLWYFLIIAAALLGVGIYLIVHINKNLNKVIKQKEEALAKIKAEVEAKLNECYNDLARLNDSYDWNIPGQIMESTTGIINIDPYFSERRVKYLEEKFGLGTNEGDNRSVLGIISGDIQGNPFIVKKTLQEDYKDKTYTGELLITWETYSTDSKGNTVTHHHTQTLRASVRHKAPFYGTDTVLIYGNEAAPHLSFSREPSNINSLNSEKEIEKEVKARMKEINKKADKAISAGSSFTPIGNDEFDVFFGGTNRDNEVEFRLLFTPLAQTNMLSLLKDPKPYGDDFYMEKDNMVNYVMSRHSQDFDYSANPKIYISYDYTVSKSAFINYCDEYIKSLFFDLAPLLSIPLYQMHKPREFIYEKEIAMNYSSYEHEVLANSMDDTIFMPKDADSSLPVLIKSIAANKVGNSDHVKIHSYSYKTKPMVDYVSVRGGDGCWHDVPVHWTKYDRVDDDNEIDIRYIGASRKAFNEKASDNKELSSLISSSKYAIFKRGMFALVNDKETCQEIEKTLADVFAEKNDATN